jgi:ketosteroid isomerase-like protein
LVRAQTEQGQAVEQESEKAAIDRAYRSYVDAFIAGDLSTIMKYCSTPLVVVRQQEVRVLATAADVEHSTAQPFNVSKNAATRTANCRK